MKVTPELAELIGIIIGDGFIHFGEKKYFGFTGSPKADAEYYKFLEKLTNRQEIHRFEAVG